MDSALKVNNATIKYASNYYNHNHESKVNVAVKDVSFSVGYGDYCCIVGMNGSGKSSLIKGILGLAPLASGSIEYGFDRGRISYLPQINSIPHDFPAAVKEIVLTGAQKQKKLNLFDSFMFYSKRDIEKANESMNLLKISELAKKRFGELSGGQQQKVLLARALCKNPELLILDEPCAGLDNNTVDSFYELLYGLNIRAENPVAILMITHDLHDVQKYARHIIEMNGKILFYGTVKEYKEYKEHAEFN